MNIDIILFLVLFAIIVLIILLILVYSIFIERKKLDKPVVIRDNSDIEKIKILMDKDSIQKIDDMIDSLIKSAVDKYMILNVNFDREKYLNPKEQEALALYTFGMVKKNMTKPVIDTISLIYDIDSEEKINELLNIRIKMYILAVIVNQNKDIDIRVK